MKKYLPLAVIVLLFITCKKDSKPAPADLDVTGTWTLYSWTGFPVANTSISVTQYPCLANNVLKINADGTTNTGYTGTDTCYVTPARGFENGVAYIGYAGQAPYSGVWRRSGNNIFVGSEHYVVSSANGKLFLTVSDTITANVSSPVVITAVDVKQ